MLEEDKKSPMAVGMGWSRMRKGRMGCVDGTRRGCDRSGELSAKTDGFCREDKQEDAHKNEP